MKALQAAFHDVQEDEEHPAPRKFHFPKPISEPPSPASTRPTTPEASRHGSDDEDANSHDSEEEERELNEALQDVRV